MENKWTLEIAYNYKVGDQEITRTLQMAIPPTNGDRTDILTTSLRYYYGITKKEFITRESKEGYLKRTQPELEDKSEEFKKILSKMKFTPKVFDDDIELLIEIKKGKITLKGK